MKSLYVIVRVTYDHYQFQQNLGATSSLKHARAIASGESYLMHIPVVETLEGSKELDDSETPHILIESWPQKL